jgi:hypothetical protein
MTAVQHWVLIGQRNTHGLDLTTIVAWLRAEGAVANQVAELQRQSPES